MKESAMDLGGTDCPAGLMRCRAGHLERSSAGHVPASCERGEGCSCPYEAVSDCPDVAAGCLLEDAWVDLQEGASHALCATPSLRAVPVVGPAPAGVCDSDDARCVEGELVRCATPPGRAVARCLRGCAGRGAVDPATDDRALSALCMP